MDDRVSVGQGEGVVRKLPDDLANQIAAGEVVERPASVAKELIENAVDASATRIRIDVEGGGVGLIRVSDDGLGMISGDATLALERHATSKIALLADLTRITSYGFRGEALPSIASVSRFTLRTRRRSDEAGTEVLVEGGAAPTVKPCGVAPGTTVEVRDLFFNVPARRKFLRSLATESAHVTEVAEAAALASPERTLVLAREGRIVREWLRVDSREQRVTAAFAGEVLAPCRGERGPLRVEAFLSRPERARAAASALTLLVNGRVVRDRALARAVAQAYGSVLDPMRYPLGAVYLDLEPALVDVNVHPQKAEVRFADGRAVGEALFKILADELSRAFGFPVAVRTWNRARPVEPPRDFPGVSAGVPLGPSATTEGESRLPWSFPLEAASDATPAASSTTSGAGTTEMRAYPLLEPVSGMRPSFSRLGFIAQVKQTYLLCEGVDGLYILDQHAAAERVTFHRLRTAYVGRDIATQALLFPVTVEVTASDVAFVEEEQRALAEIGLDVRAVGPSTIAVHAMPRLLARAKPESVVRDLIAELTRTGGRAFSNAVDLVLATMACHGSIRAGDRLSAEEATALLVALDAVDFSGHCPHGRPIVTRIGWDELERKVGRR
ncbi:MAG TPA: DNA mismatch repair endonuclease MutL [Polyangiaceae bacterium]|nr:DNA mismatch repair endonuclease MutL [Polyangiaceae bacterium]